MAHIKNLLIYLDKEKYTLIRKFMYKIIS